MERPFADKRPIGPFAQIDTNPRDTYLVIFTVESDMVLDGSDILELEQSMKAEQVENGGNLFAIIEEVDVETEAFSGLKDPGEERGFNVYTKITPDIEGTREYFVLSKTMIDIIERKIKNKFGQNSIKGTWEVTVVN